jgi:hypothetical protein
VRACAQLDGPTSDVFHAFQLDDGDTVSCSEVKKLKSMQSNVADCSALQYTAVNLSGEIPGKEA